MITALDCKENGQMNLPALFSEFKTLSYIGKLENLLHLSFSSVNH